MKPAQRQYNHCKSDYELTLNSDSSIVPCPDDGSIQLMGYEFKTIDEVEVADSNAVVDMVGLVMSAGMSTSVSLRNGGETVKRAVMLADHSGKQLELTMWGEHCTTIGNELQVSRAGLLHDPSDSCTQVAWHSPAGWWQGTRLLALEGC